MSEEKVFPMTAEGREKLQAELEDLISNQRPEITNRIQIARSYGDLSENSEYQSAKDEQAFVEGRILTLKKMIENAQIIDPNATASDEVSLGKTVTFKELPDEEPETYAIVGSTESDPLAGKISNESAMAVALLGKKVGDKVAVPLPSGDSIEVEILKVERLTTTCRQSFFVIKKTRRSWFLSILCKLVDIADDDCTDDNKNCTDNNHLHLVA